MSFSDQVRWSRKWGAIVLLLSALMVGMLLLIRENGAREAVLRWGDIAMLPVGMALVLLVFGWLMRPLQKKIYHAFLEANERYRSHMSVNPVMRWLLWIDREGRDRDA
jgi:SNF family Na+-dependent transporter